MSLPRCRPRKLAASCCGLLLLASAVLWAPCAHAKESGYGDANEAAYAGLLFGSSGTFTLRLSGYGADDDADEQGYMRWDCQPWRLLMERPELSPGVQLNNFGMHGGFMPISWGPLGLGVGFGFDFLTVGVGKLDEKHREGTHLLVPFGLEATAALKIFRFSRLLVAYQYQLVGGSEFDETLRRQGFSAEWFFGFGRSNFYMLLAVEYGTFEGDGHSFGAGQALAGITWNNFD